MKMNSLKGVIAGGLLLVSGLAQAQFSSTWTVTSDYDSRGHSQSAKDPALQGSLDYAFVNGFAVGAWASNVDFAPADGDLELNLYANYSGALNEQLGWTAGAVYYFYPGGDLGEYPEFFVGLNAGPVSFKQWYANDLYESGESAWYTEANASFPLPNDFSVLVRAGYSWGDYWETGNSEEIFDYSLGVGYTFGRFNFALRWTATDLENVTADVDNNEGRVIFSVATTFPWTE